MARHDQQTLRQQVGGSFAGWLAPWLCLLALPALVRCAPADAPSPEAAPASAWQNHDPAVEFVGAEACQSCHRDIHATHQNTGMGRAFHPMTAEHAVEDWDGAEVVDPERRLRYRMTEEDGRYYQTIVVEDADGTPMHERRYELTYAVGSNTHSRGYVVAGDDGLFQAPICWYPEAQLFDACPGFENVDEHFARALTDNCLFCHNGVMTTKGDRPNVYEEPIVSGIGCERCHGPGQLHVEKWESGIYTPTGERDDTIVNSAHLDIELANDVCAQCHFGDALASERVMRDGVSMRDFRPGQPLSDFIMAFRYEQPTRHDFGLSSQVDRLRRSTCYIESAALSCTACHNPHESVYDENRPDDLFRQACLSCHVTPDACPAPAEEREPVNDDCIACHMRKAEPDDQRYTEFTDHWIRRRIDDDERDYRERPEIEPVDRAAFDALPRAEQLYYEARAHHLMESDARQAWKVKFLDAAGDGYRAAIEAGYDTATANFFLGKIYTRYSMHDEAVTAYERAVELDPLYDDAVLALAQTQLELERVEPAIEALRPLLERNPGHALALGEYGRAAWMQDKYADALKAYQAAVDLEPSNATLLVNFGMALSSVGRYDEAASVAEQAAVLDPDDVDVWFYYWNVMREANRPAASRFGLRRYRGLGGR